MAEFQPPEGLRKILAEALTEPCETCSAAGSIDGFVRDMPCWDCSGEKRVLKSEDELADAVLAALFEACEVREELRIVIDDENVNGLWAPTSLAGSFFSVAAEYASGRVERRLVIETQPEPVSSTGEEKTDG